MMQAAQAASGAWLRDAFRLPLLPDARGFGFAPEAANHRFAASSAAGQRANRVPRERMGPPRNARLDVPLVARVQHNDGIAAQLPGYGPCFRFQRLAHARHSADHIPRPHNFPVAGFENAAARSQWDAPPSAPLVGW